MVLSKLSPPVMIAHPSPFLSDAVGHRDFHVLEIEHAVLDIAEADEVVYLFNSEPFPSFFENECGQVFVFPDHFGVVAGPDIGHVALRKAGGYDEPFLSIQDVDVAFPAGFR